MSLLSKWPIILFCLVFVLGVRVNLTEFGWSGRAGDIPFMTDSECIAWKDRTTRYINPSNEVHVRNALQDQAQIREQLDYYEGLLKQNGSDPGLLRTVSDLRRNLGVASQIRKDFEDLRVRLYTPMIRFTDYSSYTDEELEEAYRNVEDKMDIRLWEVMTERNLIGPDGLLVPQEMPPID